MSSNCDCTCSPCKNGEHVACNFYCSTEKWRNERVCSCHLEIGRLRDENKRLRYTCAKQNEEICQTLGQALGYPWFKDDQKNFPDATEEHGVCVGDHVAETLAMEAARKLNEENGNGHPKEDRII